MMFQPCLMRALLAALGTASWLMFFTAGAQARTIDTNYYGNDLAETNLSQAIVDKVAVGQTFSADINNVIQEFSFWVEVRSQENTSASFTAYIMEWDGVKATGKVLYQSAEKTQVVGSGFERVNFNPGVVLHPGKEYVAFVRINNAAETSAEIAIKGSPLPDAYAEGQQVSSGGDPTSLAWTPYGGGDAAFFATFTSTATIAGGASGVAAGLGAISSALGGLAGSGGETSGRRGSLPPQPQKISTESNRNVDSNSPKEGEKKPNSPEDPESIPTPALLPGLVGLGLSLLRQGNKDETASSELGD